LRRLAVHPFYGPSAKLLGDRGSGLVSMLAYLAFWAAALAIAKRELEERFPRGGPPAQQADRATQVMRERFARGEIDSAQFLEMSAVLSRQSLGRR
jgi:uncharacterized membrane protein